MKHKILHTLGVLWFLAIVATLTACDHDASSIEDLAVVWPSKTNAVSHDMALSVANIFTTNRGGEKGVNAISRSGSEITELLDSDGKLVAFIVNIGGGGWVIVSASTTYHPILAYSDDPKAKFSLDLQNMNGGLNEWIAKMSTLIVNSSSLSESEKKAIDLEWLEYTPTIQASGSPIPGGSSEQAVKCRNRLKELNDTYYKDGWSFVTLSSLSQGTVPASVYTTADYYNSPYQYTIVGLRDDKYIEQVGPLLTTKWSQYDGFNGKCPNNYPAGCVAIAMAQIMKYHRHPDYFDWDNMPDTYATEATQTLIADIGEKAGIIYDFFASNSNIFNARDAFIKYGYLTKITNNGEEVTGFTLPIYMRGEDSSAGHAWVCDGSKYVLTQHRYYVEYLNSTMEYTNHYGETLIENPGRCGETESSYLSMNWGWGGDADGWFTSPVVKGHNFSTNRLNLYVKPNK